MQKIYTFICSNLLAAVEKRKEAEAQAWEGVTAWEQKAFLFWRCNKQSSRVIGQTQTSCFWHIQAVCLIYKNIEIFVIPKILTE